MAIPSQRPSRFVSGVSADQGGVPTENMGLPNPANYHLFFDDFDETISISNAWTQTKSGNGTIAHIAGEGGIAQFTTNSSTPLVADICSIQTPAAGFPLPQGVTAGKKMFFVGRVTLADFTNPAFLIGLIQTTATPFTVTDGLYFLKASGSAANLVLRHSIASVNTDIVIPTAAYTLTNAQSIDLGWYVNRLGEIYAFVGTQLVGWVPAHQGGGLVGRRGPVASNLTLLSGGLTAVNLNPTIAIQSGTASSKTMNADFGLWSKER